MKVADSDCGGISSIIRSGNGGDVQQNTYHLAYLILACTPIARNRLFHLLGGILGYGQTPIGEREHSDTACLPNRHGGTRILGEEEFFHRCFVWLVRSNNFNQTF